MSRLSPRQAQLWTSDSSSDDSSYSEAPPRKANPGLSLYRRELTEKRIEISELREQLSSAREDNLRLERALAMRQLTSHEVESDLREALGRLSAGGGTRRRDGSSSRLSAYRPEVPPRLGRYQEPVPSIDRRYLTEDITYSRPSQPTRELELVKPLTYRKRTVVPGRWITHTPYEGNQYGLFQQQQMRGKHVTQPSKRDLVAKRRPRDKYVLSHQQATPDGSHLVTTLYKGNVNPTRSGGAQVRFTETEVLHQQQEALGLATEPAMQKQAKPAEYRFATVKDVGNKRSLFPNKVFGGKTRIPKASEHKVRFATKKDMDTPTRQTWYKGMV